VALAADASRFRQFVGVLGWRGSPPGADGLIVVLADLRHGRLVGATV
jgi:hypothetical protein